MKILGLDPGIQHVGLALLGGGRLLEVQEYRPPAGPLAQRLLHLERFLDHLLEHWTPQVAALEQVIYHRNVRSALTLGAARGVVLLTLARHGVEIHELSPTRVKRAVTGNGRASKAQILYMVQQLTGLPSHMGDHVADAVACALALAREFSHAVPNPRPHRG